MELEKAIAAARAAWTKLPPRAVDARELVDELNRTDPPTTSEGWRRRRVLLELALELERARLTRADWYVWVERRAQGREQA